MSNILSSVTTGIRPSPVFILVHGVDGVGKTTFAARAPSPLFIGVESGTFQLDVARLPAPETFPHFLAQLAAVGNETHSYRTLCIDSLDWLEPIIWQHVCDEVKCKHIELALGGYGKGYARALDHWRDMLKMLSILHRRMHIVLIAHSLVKRFDDPEQNAAYDRYQVALNDKAAMLVRQAADCVLFCNYKTQVINVKGMTGKGKGGTERVMYTQSRPAFDAKNRFNLPFEMALDWPTFGQHVKAFYATPAPKEKEGAEQGEAPASAV